MTPGLPALDGWSDTWSGNLPDAVTSHLDFTRFFSQATRLLQIDTVLPDAALVVEKLHGREAVNEPFRFEVDCLSTSAHLPLKALLGTPVTLRLLRADGGWRTWHGHVVQAAQLGSDGGAARYRLSIASWLHFLALRQNSVVYQDRTALQIVEAICAEHQAAHGAARWRVDVSPGTATALRVREVCMQYQESDLAFVSRLLAEEGLSYHFEHDAAPDAGHTLVITDALSPRADLGSLRMGRPGVRGADGMPQDTLTQFSSTCRVRPTAVTLATWRPTQLVSAAGQAESVSGDDGNNAMPPLEVYTARSHAHPSLTNDHAAAHAQARLDALRLQAATFDGHGAVRTLAAGSEFDIAPGGVLDGLPMDDVVDAARRTVAAASNASADNIAPRYTVLAVEHHAANNLGSQAARLLDHADVESGTYHQRFEAVSADTPVVPLFQAKPTARHAQLAEVVGLQNEALTTDRNLRVKVQFPWQRGAQPLAGGLTDTGWLADSTGERGNATRDERSGFWLRVAQPSAGANWGSAFVPRIGAEVLVDFIDGDIDQPVVIGQLPTPNEPLPWPAGAHTGTNHPGAISGLRSQGLPSTGHDANSGNEWLLDDTAGQLRMRLRSWGATAAHGELSLGHIVQQGDAAQRGPWLGQGFYAQTDGWAIMRAGQGLLLTTAARARRGTSVESTQMDAAEALAALRSARQLGQALSDNATRQGALALDSHSAGQALDALADSIDPVETFNEPHIVLDSAASLIWATSGPVATYSGQHTSLVAGRDLHAAAAHTFSTVSGRTTSLYTHAGGLQAVAANGSLSLRAHTDAQELLADQNITLTSSADGIHIQAADSIVLTAGQSRVELKGGDITFTCPGTFTVKAASHAWDGADHGDHSIPELPDGLMAVARPDTPTVEPAVFSQRLALYHPVTGDGLDASFRIIKDQSMVDNGRSSLDGLTPRWMQAEEDRLMAIVGPSTPWSVEYHDGEEAHLFTRHRDTSGDPQTGGT